MASDLKDVTVAILAGGLGTRLVPILSGQQKVVVKVREHPFLEYILSQLNKSDLKKVVICTGHLGDQVKRAFGNNYKSLSLFYSNEDSALGTAGAIALALPYLKSENIIIMNGDSFYDGSLQNFYEYHLGKNANGTILLTKVSNISRYGKVEIDQSGQIVKFEEKNKNRGAGLINAGVYLLKRSLLLEIPNNKAVSFEKDMFARWIIKGLYGFKGQGKFIDIGTPDSYREAEEFFSKYSI